MSLARLRFLSGLPGNDDDWKNIQFNFKEGVAQIDGLYPDPTRLPEMDGEILDNIVAQVDENTVDAVPSIPGGTYSGPQVATLRAEGQGNAIIYYTTNGADPTL